MSVTDSGSRVHLTRQCSQCRNCICDWLQCRTPSHSDSCTWTRLCHILHTPYSINTR